MIFEDIFNSIFIYIENNLNKIKWVNNVAMDILEKSL